MELRAMSMLPPARRNWCGVTSLNISADIPKITWLGHLPIGKQWYSQIKAAGLRIYCSFAWERWCCHLTITHLIEIFAVVQVQLLVSTWIGQTCYDQRKGDKPEAYNYKKLCSLARKGIYCVDDGLYLEMLEAAFLQGKKPMDIWNSWKAR